MGIKTFIEGKTNLNYILINSYFIIRHELVSVKPKTNDHLKLIRHFEDNYGVK